jgi:serine/threonine-protein phosphatase 2B regulatory subunit
MGAEQSRKRRAPRTAAEEHFRLGSAPRDSDYKELAESFHFTVSELKTLYGKFVKLSKTRVKDGKIDGTEFQDALGLKTSGFGQRIFASIDRDGSQAIDFYEFVSALSALSSFATLEEKAEFCFGVYDLDGSGSIERDELKEVLVSSLAENSAVKLGPEQVEAVIGATFRKFDTDGDGKISLTEFTAQAKKNPSILNCVNLDIRDLLT